MKKNRWRRFLHAEGMEKMILLYSSLAPVGIFRGEARSTKGGLVRGVAAWGFRGAEPPDAWEVFKKFVKNQWKIYNFLKNFQGNFAIFFKFFSNFYRKFREKCRKFR